MGSPLEEFTLTHSGLGPPAVEQFLRRKSFMLRKRCTCLRGKLAAFWDWSDSYE